MQKIAEQQIVIDNLTETAKTVERTLRGIMSEQTEIEPRLKEAMEYALFGQGKRVRGSLILWICQMLCGRITHEAKIAAAVIEMVHTYSLVHDDLPAMDNDDLRRGRPTLHKQYDDATAILAGDGLLTLAFEVLATNIEDSHRAIKMVGVLACVAGPSGMVAGQMADMLAETKSPDIAMVDYIHCNKTAMMFSGAGALGAIAAGAKPETISNLTIYGLKIGLGFQIADDILDVTASSEELGKTAGKDTKQGKATYPAIAGMEKSREAAEKLAAEAMEMLDCFGDEAAVLRGLIFMLLNRTK